LVKVKMDTNIFDWLNNSTNMQKSLDKLCRRENSSQGTLILVN